MSQASLYTNEQVANLHQEQFAFLEVSESEHTLYITLDRARKKNAMHPHLLNELAFALHYAKVRKEVWTVVLGAKGNVFCAGADLKAFMGISEPFESSIPAPNGEVLIGRLFPEVHKPVFLKLEGDVYAGGIILLATATYIVAADGVRMGLPEVKRGLFPYQVMAALLEVMPQRKVIDWCVRGNMLSTQEGLDAGLLTHVVPTEEVGSKIKSLIEEIHANSPSAIRLGLGAFDHIKPSGETQAYLNDVLKKTLATKDAQEGLLAFKEKRKPNWTGE